MKPIYIYVGIGVFICLVIYLWYKRSGDTDSSSEKSSRSKSHESTESQKHVTFSDDRSELVLFYSETCGPCQAMKPNWDASLEKLRSIGLKVTEFSFQNNPEEIKRYGIQGFPTIYLFPNGRDSPNNRIVYAGNRSVESICKFGESRGKMD